MTAEELAWLANRAVRRATETVLAFERMGNPVGKVRAQCLLVRALVAAGKTVEAAQQLRFAERESAKLQGSATLALPPLVARVNWARGVLWHAINESADARAALLSAVDIFNELRDGRSRRMVSGLLSLWGLS